MAEHDTARWRRVKEIFREAMELDSSLRSNYLMEACGNDIKLREDVEFLLRREDAADCPEETGLHETHEHSAASDRRGLRVRCPDCSAAVEVPVDTSFDHITCGSCGSHISLIDEDAETRAACEVAYVGHFRLIERLGMGGYGTVWKAHDTKLDRTVALKIPRKGQLAAVEIEKFLREARAAAQLRHANIVSVHEVGRDGDTVYIVSDLVRGVSLAEWLSDKRVTVREALTLCVRIASALNHAHEMNVVHRDLKPQNILIDAEKEPHLTDFGLAKRETGEITMTVDGQLLGTPAYMPPEQASGKGHEADRRADIYSLGVVLFRLITGQLPFRGTRHMVLHQVLHDDPPNPRTFDNGIPRDVETICMKCLEKDPIKRYQTANEFRNDLERYLAGQPILARPVSSIGRFSRWCNRNRTVASLVTIVATLLLTGSIVATIAAWRFNGVVRHQKITLADMHTTSGLYANEKGEIAEAALWFANAAALSDENAPREQYNRLRFWNWSRTLPLPKSAWFLKEPWTAAVEVHPQGEYVVTKSRSGHVSMWDASGEKVPLMPAGEQTLAASWSRDGRWVAAANSKLVHIYSMGHRRLEGTIPAGSASVVAFGHDSDLLVVGGSSLQVWNWRDKTSTDLPFDWEAEVTGITLSPDGTIIAASFSNQTAAMFSLERDVGTRLLFDPVTSLGMFGQQPTAPVLIDDGEQFVTQTGAKEATIWDATSGEKLRSITAPDGEQLLRVVSSPDNQHFVVCNQRSAHLWKADTLTRVGDPMPHRNFVYAAAFSSDGRWLTTASADRKVRVWSVPAGKLSFALAHQDEVWFIDAAQNGDTFVTIQGDGLLRLWPTESWTPIRHTIRLDVADHFMKVSSDGRYVWPTGWNFTRSQTEVQVFEIKSGKTKGQTVQVDGLLNGGALHPNGRHLVALSSSSRDVEGTDRSAMRLELDPGLIHFFDWTNGQQIMEPVATPSEPLGAAYSPQGDRVVVVCAGGEIDTFDGDTGQNRTRSNHGASFQPGLMVRDWVRFFPNGQSFLTWGLNHSVHAWDAKSGKKRYSVHHNEGWLCHDLAFSPDGQLFATASSDTTAKIITAETGTPARAPFAHPDWVLSVKFSPDGRQLLTACRDGMARLWNIESGELVCPPFEHDGEVLGVDFSPDGRFVCSCSRDGVARVWETATGKPITPSLPVEQIAYQFTVTPDGQFGLISGAMDSLTVLNFSELIDADDRGLDAAEFRILGELLSGQRIYLDGGVANLTSQEWFSRWLEGRQLDPVAGQR